MVVKPLLWVQEKYYHFPSITLFFMKTDYEKMYRKELNKYTRILGKNIVGKFVSLKFNLKRNGLCNTIKKIIEHKR